MHVVLVAVLQVRGQQLHPLLPDQGDEHAAGGQLGLDLVKPSHSRSQRSVVEEHVVLAKVLLELHVNRPRGALSIGPAIVDEDLQRSRGGPVSRHAVPLMTPQTLLEANFGDSWPSTVHVRYLAGFRILRQLLGSWEMQSAVLR